MQRQQAFSLVARLLLNGIEGGIGSGPEALVQVCQDPLLGIQGIDLGEDPAGAPGPKKMKPGQ